MADTVTACVIARDEQLRLPGCLASLAFCDEVVVVDSGSRDRTVEIARAAGAVVVEHPWRGFAVQRNVAIDHATGDWVLEVDADERVTPELAAEIRAFLAGPPDAALALGLLPMRQRYLGALLGPAGRYPFYRARLLRRGAYRHDEARTVHEGLWPRERPWVAAHDLHHLLAGSPREALADTWAYAGLEARQLGATSARDALIGVLLRPPAKLAYNLVVLGAWRDGARGALKVALECAGDALVWVRRLGPGGSGSTRAGAAAPADGVGHFGHRFERRGPVRIVAVGAGRRAVAGERAWLQQAAAAGAWVALVTDAEEAIEGVEVDRVARLGPFALARALDRRSQLAPPDAIVPLGPRARRLLAFLPATARTGAPVLASADVAFTRDPAPAASAAPAPAPAAPAPAPPTRD